MSDLRYKILSLKTPDISLGLIFHKSELINLKKLLYGINNFRSAY